MTIKSFEEVKSVLKKFKEAEGVGYVVTPQILKIAAQSGLIGYDLALQKWIGAQVRSEKVYAPGSEIEGRPPILVSWDGPSLKYDKGSVRVGLKRTIEDIELSLDGSRGE